jgi:hypothetical protein
VSGTDSTAQPSDERQTNLNRRPSVRKTRRANFPPVADNLPIESGVVVRGTGLDVSDPTAGGGRGFTYQWEQKVLDLEDQIQGITAGSGSGGVAYTEGNGIDIAGGQIGVNIMTPGGLAFENGSLLVQLHGSGGLDVVSQGVMVTAGDGVKVDGHGVHVNIRPGGGGSNSGGLILDSSNHLTVLVDGTAGLQTTTTGVGAVAGLGIVVGSTIAIDTTLVARRFAASVGDGSATSIVVAHNLGTRDVHVDVYATSAPYETVYPEVQRTDTDNVTLVFGTAPTSEQYRCVVVG